MVHLAPREIEKWVLAVSVISASSGGLSCRTCIAERSDVEPMMLITVSAMCPREGREEPLKRPPGEDWSFRPLIRNRIAADWNLGKLIVSKQLLLNRWRVGWPGPAT